MIFGASFFKDFVLPTLESLGGMLLKIVIVITIVIVSIEILKAFKILNWINERLYFITKFLGISKNASLSLLIGVLIGITYGAGLMLYSYKNKEISKKDVFLVCVFLSVCHAIFEDTLLFAAFGSVTWLLVVIKIALASILTVVFNLFLRRKFNNQEQANDIENQ